MQLNIFLVMTANHKISRPLEKLIVTIGIVLLLGCSNASTEELLQTAQVEIKNGNYEVAIISLKNALNSSPKLPQIRLLLGETYFQLGLFAEAEKELRKAQDLGAELDRVAPLLVKALHYQHFLDQAFLYSEKFTSDNTAALSKVKLFGALANIKSNLKTSNQVEDINTDIILGDDKNLLESYKLFVSGELTKALEQVQALEPDYEALETSLLKGMIYAASQKYSKSEEHFKQVITLAPTYYIAYYQLSEILIKNGKLDQAQKYVDTLLSLNNQHAYSNLLNAKISFRKDKYDTAFTSATLAVQNGIDSTLANLIAGISSFKIENFESAYRHLNKISADLPSNHYAQRVLAELKLRLGQTDGLKELVSKFSENSSDDSNLLAATAISMFRQGDVQDAIQFFEKSNKIAPNNAINLMREGLMKISVKDYSGIKVLEDAVTSDEEMKYAWSLLAQAHLENGSPEEALATAKKWKQINQVDGDTLEAYILLQLNRTNEARQILERVNNKTSNHIGALRFLMLLNAREKRFELAKPLAEKLITLNNKNFQYYVDFLNISIALNSADEAEEYLHKLLDNTDDKEASIVIKTALSSLYNYQQDYHKIIETLTSIRPLSDNRALTMLGDTYFYLKDFSSAYKIYNAQLNTNPESKSNWLKILAISENTRDFTFGLKVVEEAKKKFMDDFDVNAYYAIFLLKNNKVDDAKSIVDKLSLQNTDSPILNRLYGELSLASGDTNKALNQLYIYYKESPDLNSAKLLAEAMAVNGDVQLGGQYIANELAHSITTTRDLHYLAEFYTKYEEFSKSAEIYKKLIANDPKQFITLNNYASVLIQLERNEEAYDYANKALKIIPDAPYAMDTAGWALFKQGKVKEALYYLDKAYEKLPTNPEVQLHYAESLLADNQKTKAKRLLNSIKPRNSREREELKQLVNSI